MNERSAAFDRASLAVGVLLLVGAVVVMVVAGLARGESEVAIEATGMRPGFELSGHDYTVSCEQPVDVTVSAGGGEARIGAGGWRAGEQERTLELEPGGAVVVELRTPGTFTRPSTNTAAVTSTNAFEEMRRRRR